MSAPPSHFVSARFQFRARRLLVVVGLCACVAGCVQRRMTIRSNPPGALVYVDDYEIGTTPVSHNFTYYGTRKIRLVKNGYQTLTVMQSFPPPWYQIFPLDFITENFVPGVIRDRRTVAYQLAPQIIVPPDQLLGRAEDLRRRAQLPRAVVPASTLPGTSPLPPRGPEIIPAPPSVVLPPVTPYPEPTGPMSTGPMSTGPMSTGPVPFHPLPPR